MKIINPYRFGTQTGTLLLDETGIGSAHTAYSVSRKLRDAYAGSCIRVRRSSDNTEQDIGFSSNVLDQSALTTFVGANDGFVVTIYDQSGNGFNATQATTTKQPQIVSGGSVITDGGKPAMQFGSDELLAYSSGVVSSFNTATFMAVYNATATNGASYIKIVLSLTSEASTPPCFRSGRFGVAGDTNKQGIVRSSSATAALSATANTNQMLGVGLWSDTALSWYENDNSEVTGSTASGTYTNDSVTIGGRLDGSVPFLGDYVQEAVIWKFDVEAYVETIKSNVNAFYSIY